MLIVTCFLPLQCKYNRILPHWDVDGLMGTVMLVGCKACEWHGSGHTWLA